MTGLVLEAQPLVLDGFAPLVGQVVGHAAQARPRRQGGFIALGAREHQEGLHQVAHLLGGAGDPLHLGASARVEVGVVRQQLA
ncbi:hypothetical protein D9M71_827870 [compost metagenome]